MTPDQLSRYQRHLLLKEVGGQGQQKLLSSRVLVIGAGGLGAPIIQYLAAAGVGVIGVADDDRVETSNLQRQVIYETGDVGATKIDAVERSVAAQNPDISIIKHDLRVNEDNAATLMRDYDLVIEGVDNFATRFAINRAAIASETPLISGAVGRFDGQIATFKPFERPGVWPCYRCFVPAEPPRDQQVNCAEEGVLGAVTGVIGTLMAMEALKDLLSLGDGLAGRLLLYDGLAASFRTVALPADPACPDCGALQS